jgi:hypothetical protein
MAKRLIQAAVAVAVAAVVVAQEEEIEGAPKDLGLTIAARVVAKVHYRRFLQPDNHTIIFVKQKPRLA